MSPRAASLVVRRLVAPPAAQLFRLPARWPPVVSRRRARRRPLSFARRLPLPRLVAARFARPGALSCGRRFVRPGPLPFARRFVGPGSLALGFRLVLPGIVAGWFAAPGPLSFARRFIRPRPF